MPAKKALQDKDNAQRRVLSESGSSARRSEKGVTCEVLAIEEEQVENVA